MNIEYETKVLDIEPETIRKKLASLDAKYIGKKDFRRYVYDMTPPIHNKRVRLRADGNKTTLACKHIIDPEAIDGVKEWEVQVDSFETCHELLVQLGYMPKAYQENIRESYVLDDCEIEIDTRPLIPSYMEIESINEKNVLSMIHKLDLEKYTTTSLNTTQIYAYYGIEDLNMYKYLLFEKIELH